jgi:hypothetical protein
MATKRSNTQPASRSIITTKETDEGKHYNWVNYLFLCSQTSEFIYTYLRNKSMTIYKTKHITKTKTRIGTTQYFECKTDSCPFKVRLKTSLKGELIEIQKSSEHIHSEATVNSQSNSLETIKTLLTANPKAKPTDIYKSLITLQPDIEAVSV